MHQNIGVGRSRSPDDLVRKAELGLLRYGLKVYLDLHPKFCSITVLSNTVVSRPSTRNDLNKNYNALLRYPKGRCHHSPYLFKNDHN